MTFATREIPSRTRRGWDQRAWSGLVGQLQLHHQLAAGMGLTIVGGPGLKVPRSDPSGMKVDSAAPVAAASAQGIGPGIPGPGKDCQTADVRRPLVAARKTMPEMPEMPGLGCSGLQSA